MITLPAVTLGLIEQYKLLRKTQVANNTVNRELTVIKAFFNQMVNEGKLYKNPLNDPSGRNIIKALKVSSNKIRFLEHEEIKRLLVSEDRPRWKAIIGLAINTGLRKSEIQNLTWDKIDFKRKILTVADEGTFKTKSRRIRYIPMNQSTENILSSIEKHGRYVFGVGEGDKPFRNNFDQQFRKILKRAKIENCRFHDLRHTFASHLVMAGVPIPTVQALMGHQDVRTTMIYSHISPLHKQQSVELLSFN